MMLPGTVRSAFCSSLLRANGAEPERFTVIAVSPESTRLPPTATVSMVPRALPSAAKTRPPVACRVPA